ncbi:MAG TPA: hypothetical protein VNI58_10165 [Mariprofundaceae bacterium]|nr:hypothetical protein [Mariprofundaceae bacterium]
MAGLVRSIKIAVNQPKLDGFYPKTGKNGLFLPDEEKHAENDFDPAER